MNYDEIMSRMQDNLRAKCESRGLNYVIEDDITSEINLAIFAVNNRRRFDATPLIPFEPQYEQLIVQLALASITKMGAEGQTSHSENGISRSYDNAGNYPEALLSMIVPLAKAR